jgi:uncharacterized protein YxeA
MGIKSFLIVSALVVVAFIGSCYLAYQNGYDARDSLVKSEKLDLAVQEQQRQLAQQQVADTVLKGLSDWKQNTETIVEKTYHEKTNPVFVNICATDDAVRLFNEKTKAATTRLSSGINTKVPNK